MTRWSRKVLARTVGCRLVGYTIMAPASRGARNPGFMPYMWESGRIERIRVSVPSGTTPCSEVLFATMLRWLSMTPFGSPVLPEVNTISASAPGSVWGAGAAAAPTARSTSDSTVITGSSSRLAAFRVGIDASTSFGLVCAASLEAKTSVERTSMGTEMARAHWAPSEAMPHSGRGTAQMSTRSPGPTPASPRSVATRGTRSPICP